MLPGALTAAKAGAPLFLVALRQAVDDVVELIGGTAVVVAVEGVGTAAGYSDGQHEAMESDGLLGKFNQHLVQKLALAGVSREGGGGVGMTHGAATLEVGLFLGGDAPAPAAIVVGGGSSHGARR